MERQDVLDPEAADARFPRLLGVLSGVSSALAAEAPAAVRLRAAARTVARALGLTTALDIADAGHFLAYPGPETSNAGVPSEFSIAAGNAEFGTLRVLHGGFLEPDERATLVEAAKCIGLWLQSTKRHDRDRELAEHLQAVLLPQTLPEDGHVHFNAAYRPASRDHVVGGDWYDAFALEDGRIAFSVGDVAGHGLGAAVVMGEVRQAFRAAAIAPKSPSVVIERANAIVNLRAESTMVTAVFGILEPDHRTFTYSCAGHPPPLLAMESGFAVYLPGGGVPLGVTKQIDAPDWTFSLTPHSVLFLYTDGAIEYDRAIREGEERLLAAASRIGGSSEPRPALRLIADIFRVKDNMDDVAVLALANDADWTNRLSLTFSATPLSVPILRSAVRLYCERLELDESLKHDVELSCAEAAANVVLHAYGDEPGTFRVEMTPEGDSSVVLTVEDWGTWKRSAAREQGGRGLKIVRALMDQVEIETEHRHTTLRARKKIEHGPREP